MIRNILMISFLFLLCFCQQKEKIRIGGIGENNLTFSDIGKNGQSWDRENPPNYQPSSASKQEKKSNEGDGSEWG